MTDLLCDQEGVAIYQDDVVIAGSTTEEHDRRLNATLGVIKEAGLNLNKAKCGFRQESLLSLGHMFNKDDM